MGVAGVGGVEGVSEEASRGADHLWEEERDPDSAAVRAGVSPPHLGRVVSLTWRSALGVSHTKVPFSVITRSEMSNFSEPSELLFFFFVTVSI